MPVEYLEEPKKSKIDTNKEYRVIRLQNGLTAMLIADLHSETCVSQDDDQAKATTSSEYKAKDKNEDFAEEDNEDEDEDTSDKYDEENSSLVTKRVKRNKKEMLINHLPAGCGLCVGVGGFSDLPEIPGLAHFLEHMIFMGSERYPQENDFDEFIFKRGGYTNATTDCEHTTFHFDVQEKHLFPALDRFAQFFINPLMKKDAMTREREAVESEFQMFALNDIYRKKQLLSSFARAGHPANKFTCGNLITLRDNVDDEELYAELHKFRKRHYSAHRMKLAIQARLSLDTLEEYVTTCFADVPSNGLPPDDFTVFKGGISFETLAFRRMYKIKPAKNLSQLHVTWVIPSLLDSYKSKPLQYISHLIEYEDNGFLICYLRGKMWSFKMLNDNSESGFAHSSIFPGGENPTKCALVKDLCRSMHYYTPRDYITGNEFSYEYDPEVINKCLDYLQPENANILIFNEKFNAELDKIEPWFKTRYTEDEIPQEWIERWRTIQPLSYFSLSEPNKFFCSNFSLIPMPQDIPKYPMKIYSDTISEIWYRPDPVFRQPECHMYFYFVSPLRLESLKKVVLMDLYCSVLKLHLNKEISSARAAGLYFEIFPNDKGIIMTLNGFNEKLPFLLLIFVKYMLDYPTSVTNELFELMKQQELKRLYNTFITPSTFISDVKYYILKRIHYTSVDIHRVLRKINFKGFQNFTKSFNDRLYIQCLVQGNISQKTVLDQVRLFIKLINCKSLHPSIIPQIRIIQIPLGTNYCKLRNMNRTDVNSVVLNYYQAEVVSIELQVLLDLLEMVMLEPLVNQLRTKDQLGYDVSCFGINIWGVLGYCITVHTQADKYTTEHVDQRIEDFLKSFNKILEGFSEKDLDEVKEALRQKKQCADIDLQSEVRRNWNEIVSCEYMFDRREKEVIAIKDIKINDLREWIAKHMLNGSNFRKLSIHVVGRSSMEDTVNELIAFYTIHTKELIV